LTLACAGLLEPKRSALGLLKLRLTLRISCAGCLGLQAFRRSSLLKCALQTKIVKDLLKPVFGDLRSFKVIDVNKFKKLVTSACYDEQHICTYLQLFLHQTSQ